MDVLKRILELRLKKKWTEYEFAKQSDLPQSTISSWYKKGMLPSISSLEKICAGLDISLSQFFCEGDNAVELTQSQKDILDKYAGLTDTQKEKLNLFIDRILY